MLSVLATGALVLLGGPLADRWAGTLGRPLATALALPVAAQLVCAPVILLLTPAVSLYAVPANVLAAPAVAPATVLGLAAGCVAPWWAAGAQVLALGAGAACWWIGAVGRVAAAAPGAQLAWLPGWTGAACSRWRERVCSGCSSAAVHGRRASVRSGRLCPCLPPPAAPPPVRPRPRPGCPGRRSSSRRSCS